MESVGFRGLFKVFSVCEYLEIELVGQCVHEIRNGSDGPTTGVCRKVDSNGNEDCGFLTDSSVSRGFRVLSLPAGRPEILGYLRQGL